MAASVSNAVTQVLPFRRHKRSFKPETTNQNLSLGGSRGPFSFVKENGPLVRVPCAARGTQSSASRCKNCNFAYNCPQYKQ